MPKLHRLRLLLLLNALVASILYAGQQHYYSRSWLAPLIVTLYPINGDGLPATREYIAGLGPGRFTDIDRWMAREARRYELPLANPVSTHLGPPVDSLPPPYDAPASAFAGSISNLVWGLRMRLWAALHTPDTRSNLDRVRIFVVYYSDPQAQLPHSLGLQKGLLGVVHAYALPSRDRQNNIVIAHELLHTVGASDKYDRHGTPIYPIGYAEPLRNPLFPQPHAEIMAGRQPLSLYESRMPAGLRDEIIGPLTAREINWLR